MDFWGGAKKAFGYTPIGAAYNAGKKAVSGDFKGAADAGLSGLPWYAYGKEWTKGAKGALGFMDPANPYQTAAAGAMEASRRSADFSNTQWDRSQQGLAGALGEMGLSSAFGRGSSMDGRWYNPASGSVFHGAQQYLGDPSQSRMGQSYGGLADQLRAPSASSSAYNTAQGYLSGPTRQAQLSTQFNPSQTGQAYNQFSGIYGNQGAMESYAPGAMSQLGGQGSYESWYGANKNMYGQPTSTSRLYENNWGGYGTAGRSEGYRPTDTMFGQQYNQGAQQRMSGPTATQQGAGGVASQYQQADYAAAPIMDLIGNAGLAGRSAGYFTGANDVRSFGERNLAGMEQPGMFEQFAEQALRGDNPAIARAREQGMAALNQQLAARGRFNSGAAGFTLGNFASDMAAKEWDFKGQMAQGGQQARMQRLGQAQGLAQGMSDERMGQGRALMEFDVSDARNKLDRGNALRDLGDSRARLALGRGEGLQSLLGQLDDGVFQRESALARAAGLASEESLSNTTNTMTANDMADRNRLTRLAGMADLAQANDRTNLDWLDSGARAALDSQKSLEGRLSLGSDIASRAQTAAQQRADGGMAASQMVDRSYFDRLAEERQRAAGADASTLAAQLGLTGMAERLDATTLDRLKQQWTMGQDLDTFGRESFQTLGNLANNYDQNFQNSQKTLFDMLFSGDKERAGLYSDFYGNGMESSGKAMTDSINAYANAMGLTGQGQGARQEAVMGLLSLLKGLA